MPSVNCVMTLEIDIEMNVDASFFLTSFCEAISMCGGINCLGNFE